MGIRQSQVPFVSVGAHPTDSKKWKGQLIGPPASPYQGHMFTFEVIFPNSYPKDPPQVKFTPVIPPHMNVYSDGFACLTALTKENWGKVKNMKTALANLYALF